MNFKEWTRSTHFTRICYGIGALIILLAVFQAGVMVGIHKAKFAFHMGENYYQAFGRDEWREHGGMPFTMHEREFTEAHGAVGKIIKVSLPTLIILGPDQIEKTVIVSPDTAVRHFRDTGSVNDLTLDAYVVVIGSPNDHAEIDARLIRILPPPIGARTSATANAATSSTTVK